MSSLLFAQAKKIRKEVLKTNAMYEKLGHSQEDIQIRSEQIITHQCNEFREILLISEKLKEVFREVSGNETKNWFFITIRPHPQISWNEFHAKVMKYLKRSTFISYTCSFEQKGITHATLGEGFHAHIVADCKWRSKPEALRDTFSTFNKMCAENCIQVVPTRGPDELIKNYLIEYKSDDNHKECTKKWDTLWREKIGIQHIISNMPKWNTTIEDITSEKTPSPPVGGVTDQVRTVTFSSGGLLTF